MTPPGGTYAVSLVLTESGWRVHVVNGQAAAGEIGYGVTTAQAEHIARTVGDQITHATPSPYEVIRTGTDALRARLETKIKEAETVATKIAAWRKQREELG